MSDQPTRGERNNNPGNIRRSNNAWLGKTYEATDPDFETFSAPVYGIRAVAKIMLHYCDVGVRTVRSIVGRWAPASENDTGAYVADVAGRVGVLPDSQMNLRDPETLGKLVSAIIVHENGRNTYDPSVIESAVSSALTGAPPTGV